MDARLPCAFLFIYLFIYLFCVRVCVCVCVPQTKTGLHVNAGVVDEAAT